MKDSEKELFQKLLDESFRKKASLETGAKVTAVVTSAKTDYVFIKVKNAGISGIILAEEFAEAPAVGQEIEAYFLREASGDQYFTICMDGDTITKDLISVAHSSEIPVLGHIVGENDAGVEVKLGEQIGFCPFSQLDPELKKQGAVVGKRVRFLVSELGAKGKIIVSQKKIADKEREAKISVLKGELKPGMFVTCRVKSVHPFGLIVEADGLTALVPTSEATFKKNPDLSKDFHPGQVLRAKVLKLDWEENKHSFTVKDFLKDPWAQNVPFKEGDLVTGTVESIKPFGVFLKLNENFSGLVPNRETGLQNRIPAAQHFKVGESLSAFVTEVNLAKRQISLSLVKAKEVQERLDYSGYLSEETSSTGSFGAILAKSLNKGQKKN
ncbi:S1 RNA-binding domain-containing protein [Leptospira wolffii]|uniref:30S ribosomal protein S1 n=1 Tax=Leptospira wolffii TaxID=409998 RepID=A0A2M9ZG66_9LEPT|nr:S1 RNA-binding domain-containing protein [Leptospira wolffii]PJZ67413.1 30S ribosomal protein S1 [Leptospira wolffii]TGK62411.1 S1 RNA-binding domain-containing protein [Leptospira wolffii]TGK70649.1 S1 RNA-binding domain-containing protein [Leptospira wolffii]TGK74205.1 S1 RNA-binding domain-containing protein [Leptospira wolffii]TGL32220.1 S1 RNA-binding domain-containing protein [Leptospira wolffii]